MELSPIVLFVYNRPDHTRQTVEALQKNFLAKNSELFIFSDAPKNQSAASGVAAVRQYLYTISGFKKVSVVERQENLGLAKSIVQGVTEIVNKYGRVIVLEDDLVTSPYFLQYMNDGLEMYKNEEKVMHVGGYFFPHEENLPETFFLRHVSSWGWGTWVRSWRLYNSDAGDLVARLKTIPKGVYGFNLDGAFNFFSTLRDNAEGRIMTWAIKWYASVYLHNGLCLYPCKSLVENIGHDGSGEHYAKTRVFNNGLYEDKIVVDHMRVIESVNAFIIAKRYMNKIKPTLLSRVFFRLRRFI